jgi:hypothetical protein
MPDSTVVAGPVSGGLRDVLHRLGGGGGEVLGDRLSGEAEGHARTMAPNMRAPGTSHHQLTAAVRPRVADVAEGQDQRAHDRDGRRRRSRG